MARKFFVNVFFDVANVDFLCYMRYSLMLHMLFLNVAKKFTYYMQHLRMLQWEFSLLNYRPMLGLDVGRGTSGTVFFFTYKTKGKLSCEN
jgi:hypothetical protein